jgi:hypothetical protein
MKLQTTIITLFICYSITATAQEKKGTAIKDMYLQGKWTCTCPYEVQNGASITYCGVCSAVTGESGSMKSIEINFLEDSIVLVGDTRIALPYKRNHDNHAISFNLGKGKYEFHVFFYGDERILVDKNTNVMVLEKKE